MIRLVTAGESHGPQLTAILEGLPAGLPLDEDLIRESRIFHFGRSGFFH